MSRHRVIDCDFLVNEPMSASLRQRWHNLWTSMELPVPRALGEDLLDAWREGNRHYHTLRHLVECLALLDRFRHLAKHPDDIELALWLHDLILDPKAFDNEERSAIWAEQVLPTVGLPLERVARVAAMVRATAAHAQPADADAQLMLDIDLGILAAAPERLDQYERQIQAEYAWVPWATYREARMRILGEFQARSPLYVTEAFRTEHEVIAHANLERLVAWLAAQETDPRSP